MADASITPNMEFLNSENIEAREYQLEIVSQCVGKNSLVVLPTGLGKTIIALFIAAKTLERYPKGCKIIIMAPTRPLISQHYQSFRKYLIIPSDSFKILTGKILPEKREFLFKENQVLFYTPQTLRNDIVNKKYELSEVALIIFDEAHHASGDYPYGLIADMYMDHNPDGTILALTASPGATKKKISELCQILHIPIGNIHLRTRKDTDVKEYLKPMNVYKVGVELTNLMLYIYEEIKNVLIERLNYLLQFEYLSLDADSDEDIFSKVIKKDLVRISRELTSIIKSDGSKTGIYSAMTINAQALILYHMIDLIEQQGLDVLLEYLEKMKRDSKKKTSSKAIKVLASDIRLRNVYIELKKNLDYSPHELIHPKFKYLKKVILKELKRKKNARILVFVKLRDSVRLIVERLKATPQIKAVRFVGQASKSKKDMGLSQKKQIELLDEFKRGIHNVLVSTNVAEEGLDIAECDLVIFYDVVASEIRLIQRKGRTARHSEGEVVILYSKNTRDEIYLRIAMMREKKMNVNLKNPKDIKQIEKEQESRQKKLMSFIELKKNTKTDNVPLENVDVKLSNRLPMKFGVRHILQEAEIPFAIWDAENHINLFDKVIMHFFDFDEDIQNTLLRFHYKNRDKFELILNIIDFIDFEENFKGQKYKIKEKLKHFGDAYNLQIIPVDNEEEVFFIFKNIYFHNKQQKQEGD
ncbi:MAG: DEAD/DEAH box helicase [Promethearchaeota archaeon]